MASTPRRASSGDPFAHLLDVRRCAGDQSVLPHAHRSGADRGYHACSHGAASSITECIRLVAAAAVCEAVGDDLSERYVIPSGFDLHVVPLIASAVARATSRRFDLRPKEQTTTASTTVT